MSSPFAIRKALPEDADAVYRFICELKETRFDRAVFNSVYEENLRTETIYYAVAVSENEVGGFVSLHIQLLLHHLGKVAEIQELYVDQAHRGKGIARSLILSVENFAKENGVYELEVTTGKKRTENVAFYEKMGYPLTHNKFTKLLHGKK